MKFLVKSMSLFMLLCSFPVYAYDFNREGFFENLTLYDKSSESCCAIGDEGVFFYGFRISDFYRWIEGDKVGEEFYQNIDSDIKSLSGVENFLMRTIVKGEYNLVSNLGCDVVGLHGSVSQHIRQLNNIKICAHREEVSCNSSVRILTENARRGREFINICLSVLN